MKKIGVFVIALCILTNCSRFNEKKKHSTDIQNTIVLKNELIDSDLKIKSEDYGFNLQVLGFINDYNIRIRKIPTVNAEIVGKLQKGTEINVLGRTLESETIEKSNAYWFKISNETLTGWVFGEYVDLHDFGQNALPVLVPDRKSDCDYEIINSYEKQQIELILKSQNDSKLISIIPYSEYNSNIKFQIIDTSLFFLNRIGEIIEVELSTGKKNATGIYSDGCFGVSSNKRYICVSKKTDELIKSDLETNIPEVYNLDNKKKIEVKDFTTDFLQSEIGIALNIKYQTFLNCFEIAYTWDTPVPLFEGYISLEDFTFTRTK